MNGITLIGILSTVLAVFWILVRCFTKIKTDNGFKISIDLNYFVWLITAVCLIIAGGKL